MPSTWRLLWDLLWGHLLLGLTRAEQRGELWPQIHRFMADRYDLLADEEKWDGRPPFADRLARAARYHAELAGRDDEDPPPACAMGLPRERRQIAVEARGTLLQGRWPGSRASRTPSR
jgi:hypothetical protein